MGRGLFAWWGLRHEETYSVLDGMVDDVLHLELVLVVGVRGTKLPELLRQPEALADVLW